MCAKFAVMMSQLLNADFSTLKPLKPFHFYIMLVECHLVRGVFRNPSNI